METNLRIGERREGREKALRHCKVLLSLVSLTNALFEERTQRGFEIADENEAIALLPEREREQRLCRCAGSVWVLFGGFRVLIVCIV